MISISPVAGGHARRRLTGLAAAAALVGAACASAVFIGSGTASAASTADISVSQHISGGTASGSTVDTVTVHNAGAATANSIEAVYLLKSASHGYTVRSSTSAACQIIPAPPGYLGMVTCPLGSLASGHSVVDTLTWTGTVGVAFSVTASIGDGSPTDPNYANNTSTISSYFGPRADLRISGTLTAGATAGTGSAVTTVVNAGPNSAAALQQIIEIKGSISAVHATASTPSASCQFIPAATGYNLAVSCVTNSLATGAKWVLTLAYTGTKGS
ncbi:hypothetical protein, partial [Jatrophihabitans sp.]|uniref:hypothetical protein n=1 Tax=Jatrophihabitans sp. TaxID=1932789 RepID=UPI0030C67C70|nr:hypothetical protein [Jatrophihabitans sp.]